MKVVYCVDQLDKDINKIVQGQFDKFIKEDITEIIIPFQGKKHYVLKQLEEIEDEYIIFIPPRNVLMEKPDFNFIKKIQRYIVEKNVPYTRLRRVGLFRDNLEKEELYLWKDSMDTLALVPYLINREFLIERMNKVRTFDALFWISIEIGQSKGFCYFNQKDQVNKKYIRSAVFNCINDFVTTDNHWEEKYLGGEENLLGKLLSEYNVNEAERGTGSIGGCCR